MKYLLSLSVLFIMISCASQKVEDKVTSISYEAVTRGRSKNITLDKQDITHATHQDSKTLKISAKDREKIVKAINKLNLKEIQNLKAPSEERLFDGAMDAVIKINIDGKEYTSASFDDGNPPAELKEVVELLEKLSKK